LAVEKEGTMPRYDLKGALGFLSELALNNNRPWFEEHKADFERAKVAFESLVDEMIGRLSAFDDLPGVTARDCTLRIYRDIRFSRDKTPYKTAFAAHMAAGGRKSGRYGYGLRFEPNGTIAAGGMWEPNPEQLGRFRAAVDRNPKGLLRIIEAPKFKRAFGGLRGEKLKGPPQGFAKEHPAIEILKLKQVYAAHSFPDEAVMADDFTDRLFDTYKVLKPFLDFLNAAP
jgi:uncharacterized protein (TIGR02453 family)